MKFAITSSFILFAFSLLQLVHSLPVPDAPQQRGVDERTSHLFIFPTELAANLHHQTKL